MPRLESIVYRLPAGPEARALVDALARLAAGADGVALTGRGLTITPSYPPAARPDTHLVLDSVAQPVVLFAGAAPFRLDLGSALLTGADGAEPLPGRAVPGESAQTHSEIDPDDVADRFAGHIVRVDHTGVELPAERVSPTEWRTLLDTLAAAANLYRYPEDLEFRFILPGDDAEFAADIAAFAAPRTPKLELTYGFVPRPLLQLHLDTNLPRAEVERRLPAPAGFALPGVDSFRSVFLAHPFDDLDIRLDFTFAEEAVVGEWETGEWLVRSGGRA